jgi:hypothetical protein
MRYTRNRHWLRSIRLRYDRMRLSQLDWQVLNAKRRLRFIEAKLTGLPHAIANQQSSGFAWRPGQAAFFTRLQCSLNPSDPHVDSVERAPLRGRQSLIPLSGCQPGEL